MTDSRWESQLLTAASRVASAIGCGKLRPWFLLIGARWHCYYITIEMLLDGIVQNGYEGGSTRILCDVERADSMQSFER